MSNVYMISDLHFGHKNIMKFAGDYRLGETPEENMHLTIEMWNRRINKKDLVYVLGDCCFSREGFDAIDELRWRKILVRGNHDEWYSTKAWLEKFESVEGIVLYKGHWLTHAPIHPSELRGRPNIHGHVHHNTVRNGYNEIDKRYVNVSVENTDGAPIPFLDIKAGWRGMK